ncbi:MAG: Crp/Fnr family transcriptional regulator [Sutterellaceae bacterium]|nr:Crp/Fnr family transcriptional regulator [Sutterellaceae bacterium]MDD7441432.1 Crp/Fnr family transcriptional regulator [Sutterellaceae bacterium]MDY2869069.1 Crp/Fnr family transcriptional regulator [Mesosutterella sp.]
MKAVRNGAADLELLKRAYRNDTAWDWRTGPVASVFPYISHPVHDRIVRAIREHGTEDSFPKGAYITPPDAPIDRIVLVLSGLVARQAGSETGPIGLAPVGRFACGHLNFFTRHPAIGSYYALVPARVASLSQKRFRRLLEEDPELMRTFALQCELCTLSDRYGLATLSLLRVRERICAFLIAWARTFGRIAKTSTADTGWFILPRLPVDIACRVVNSTPEYADRVLGPWTKEGLALQHGTEFAVHSSVLLPTFAWLTRMRGGTRMHLPDLFLETAFSIPEESPAPRWLPARVSEPRP